MSLKFIKHVLGQTSLGNTRFIVVNSILLLGIVAGVIFLYFDMKKSAQLSLIVSLAALFLNRPRELVFGRHNRQLGGNEADEERKVLTKDNVNAAATNDV